MCVCDPRIQCRVICINSTSYILKYSNACFNIGQNLIDNIRYGFDVQERLTEKIRVWSVKKYTPLLSVFHIIAKEPNYTTKIMFSNTATFDEMK